MDNIWSREMLDFITGRIDTTNPANYQLILDLLKSLDDNQHLVGIDVSDVKGFLKDEAHLEMQHLTLDISESQSAERLLLEELPNGRLLYLHLDIGLDASSSFKEPCFSLMKIRDILSTWVEGNPDGEVLFSIVINRSKQHLNVWAITNERKCI